jgi:FkbM family methyltransferase
MKSPKWRRPAAEASRSIMAKTLTKTKTPKKATAPKRTVSPKKTTAPSKAKIVATYKGVEVPDAPHLGPTMIQNMIDETYERREVLCALGVITSEDRVVEMGAGAGVVGAIVAKNCSPAKMVSFEANHHLIDHITALYRHNKLSGKIEVRNQIVLSQENPPESVDFFIRGNFLGSGMEITKGEDRATQVSVPVASWADVKDEVSPTVLLMDIEGAERDFFRDADLTGIREIIVELHRHIYHRPGMKEIRQSLGEKGFSQDRERSGGGVFIFARS